MKSHNVVCVCLFVSGTIFVLCDKLVHVFPLAFSRQTSDQYMQVISVYGRANMFILTQRNNWHYLTYPPSPSLYNRTLRRGLALLCKWILTVWIHCFYICIETYGECMCLTVIPSGPIAVNNIELGMLIKIMTVQTAAILTLADWW